MNDDERHLVPVPPIMGSGRTPERRARMRRDFPAALDARQNEEERRPRRPLGDYVSFAYQRALRDPAGASRTTGATQGTFSIRP